MHKITYKDKEIKNYAVRFIASICLYLAASFTIILIICIFPIIIMLDFLIKIFGGKGLIEYA
jgi:hypothetical protein